MDSLIRNYFMKKIKKENFGQIEGADRETHGSICDNPDGDIISIFLKIADGKISDIKMECGPCDPSAIVATNIAVDVLKNRSVKEVLSDDRTIIDNFNAVLGGESKDALGHFKKVLEQLKKLL